LDNADVGRVLRRGFYARAVLELAQALLGCLLISETDADGDAAAQRTVGTIVETEAYLGQ